MADSEGAIAPAAPAGDTPSPEAWRIGGFAVATSIVASTLVHLLLVGTVLFVGPRLLQSEPATAVTVELVTPDELAAMASKPSEPPKPDPAADQASSAAPQPPAEAAQSQAPLSALASASDVFATPFLPPPAPSAPASPDPPLGQAAQLATLVGAPSVTDLNGGGASEFKANLTRDEIAAFAARVQSCWAAPASIFPDSKLYVVVRVNLRRDGTLVADPVPQAGSASALGPALADSARQALRKCAPYAGMPAAKYDEWRVLDLRFTVRGLTTASPATIGHRTPRSG